MHVTRYLKVLKGWVHVSGDRVTIQRCVPLGSMLYAELERTQTLGFDSRSRHLNIVPTEGEVRRVNNG